MPPFVARKRRRSPFSPSVKAGGQGTSLPKRETLPQETPGKPGKGKTTRDSEDGKSAYLKSLEASGSGLSSSSLSDISSAEFEDVESQPQPKRARTDEKHAEEDEDEEEIDWEDAMRETGQDGKPPSVHTQDDAGNLNGDLELTLDKTAKSSFTNPFDKKKGPSKLDRERRINTHCMHVQFLLFHNLIRNAWSCDHEVQKIMVGHLKGTLRKEVDKWREAMGHQKQMPCENSPEDRPDPKRRKGKTPKSKEKPKPIRDWGNIALAAEDAQIDLQRFDRTGTLINFLSTYWRKKFRVTAPGLRKRGYKPLPVLEEEIKSFKENPEDIDKHGELIIDLEDFRNRARKCEGSRDVGAQLFVALLRGIGMEARLVNNLQPIGFGFTKNEDAALKQKSSVKSSKTKKDEEHDDSSDTLPDTPNNQSSEDETKVQVSPENRVHSSANKQNSTSKTKTLRTSTKIKKGRGRKDSPISLSDSQNQDGSANSDDGDDASLVDVTPSVSTKRPNKPYDRDLPFPVYWAEVLWPSKKCWIPADPHVTHLVGDKEDKITLFEPRGAAADKAKQVIAYVVAYSKDGTAKDVTVRYLKKKIWPGKTKGVRMPVEKVPVYNRRGKVKKYEEYDWFKTVMSGYARDGRQRTSLDDLEDEKDLTPVKPEKKSKEGEETLQGYKNSAEFVLERHLRREEALVPGANHIKTFTTGKGDKAKEENVYLRKDVLPCKTSESWHKEGREVKPGEHPMKLVPMRAVTLNRKREIEMAEADGGEKMKQGLYSRAQTDWIIPPPIKDGIIPRNAFGNIDCYVPSMVPKGAVHLPYRGMMKACKKLDLSFAEAVIGFEFKSQRAVPLVQGVVVAEDKEQMVLDEWEQQEQERKRKEDDKREKMSLNLWRKFVTGLRILERVRQDYSGDAEGHMPDEVNPFTNRSRKKRGKEDAEVPSKSELEEQNDRHDLVRHSATEDTGFEGGGFIPMDHEDDTEIQGGGFLVENEDDTAQNTSKKTNGAMREAEISESPADLSSSPQQVAESPLQSNSKRKRAASKRKSTAAVKDVTPQSGSKGSAPTHDEKSFSSRRGQRSKQQRSDSSSSLSEASSPLPELSSDTTSESPDEEPRKKQRRGTKRISTFSSKRSLPKRSAAKKSETALRSHYFEQNDEGDQRG